MAALRQLRQIAQEVSQSSATYRGRQPAAIRALSQKLSRGFNEAINGFSNEGWSSMGTDSVDDVTIVVNSSRQTNVLKYVLLKWTSVCQPRSALCKSVNAVAGFCPLQKTLTEFLSKATGTAVEWVQMPGMKVVEILKDRPAWFRDCRTADVLNVLPTANGGTIEVLYMQLYAPTTLAPAREFWLLRYTTVMEDGSLVVCERSLSNTQYSSMPTAVNFVRAEMLPSGYLIRPCDGGGSVIHIVDHMNLEAWNVPEVLRPLYESSAVLAQKTTMATTLCSGMDESAIGTCAELLFAPIDPSFTDDAPLLPSGFLIICQYSGKEASSPNRTLDLASALEVGSAVNKGFGDYNASSGRSRSVITKMQ